MRTESKNESVISKIQICRDDKDSFITNIKILLEKYLIILAFSLDVRIFPKRRLL